MKIFVDIDDTICHSEIKGDYESATPFMDRIEKINQLFLEGHDIIFWTARGSVSGKDWSDLTTRQLNSWGVKYTEIRLGKPSYDLFIDDKNINSETFFDNGRNNEIK